MSTNYLTFFNLTDDPFRLTPDIAYFYNSPEHATALLSLEYCFKEKEGFCILTGEPGTGKTTVLRLFMDKWKDKAEIALTMTPRLSPEEFFLAILEDFKIPLKSTSKNDMLKAFRDFLLTSSDNDRRVAIIVDEAQELPETTLEELRLLSNMETEKEKLLQIILIGQPELRDKLLSKELRQLNSRITMRIELAPLSAPETSDYINNRLFRGGNSSHLFHEKSRKLIYELSGGIPRTINLLASRALMSAFLEGSREVTEKHVQQGAKDVMETTSQVQAVVPPASRLRSVILALVLLLTAVTAGLYFWFDSMQPPKTVAVAVQPTPEEPPKAQAEPPPLPVAGRASSAKKPAASSAETGFAASVTNEIGRTNTGQSAFDAFNAIAAAWRVPQFATYYSSGSDPWTYISKLAAKRGLNLIQFQGTLDQLLEIGYPAILQITAAGDGKEIFAALTGVSNGEYILPKGLAGKKQLTKMELESVWRGKAFIVWKNYRKIPSRIAKGAKKKEVDTLHKLLKQAGHDVGKSGVFNQKTVDAIKAFQSLKGLRVTGQPEPEILLLLYKESAHIYFHPVLK